MQTDYMQVAVDLARSWGVPDEEAERQAEAQRTADRRRVFAAFLEKEAERQNRKLSPWAKFDGCCKWLAQCQTYGPGCHPVIDAFVEAEGGDLLGWAQVWTELAGVMRSAHVLRERLLDQR